MRLSTLQTLISLLVDGHRRITSWIPLRSKYVLLSDEMKLIFQFSICFPQIRLQTKTVEIRCADIVCPLFIFFSRSAWIFICDWRAGRRRIFEICRTIRSRCRCIGKGQFAKNTTIVHRSCRTPKSYLCYWRCHRM